MPIQTVEKMDFEDQLLQDLYTTLSLTPFTREDMLRVADRLVAKISEDMPGPAGQRFTSTFAIGQDIEWKDGTTVRRGIIYAVTFAEVGPNGIGVWYKVHLDGTLYEVEIEEAGTEIREVWK